MATVAPTADRILSNSNHTEATDLMKKLSLETQPKVVENIEPTKKPLVDSGNGTNDQNKSYERSITPLLQDFMDPAAGYIPNYHSGYYYGSYDGSASKWDDYAKYANPDGVDLSQGVYGDNGALMYQQCYGYAPYGPYSPAGSPVPSMGHYQYPFYQPLNATSPPYNPTPVKGEISATVAADKTAPSTIETANGNGNTVAKAGGVQGQKSSAPTKQTYQNSTLNSTFQNPMFGFDGMRSPVPWPITSGTMDSSLSHGKSAPSTKIQSFQPHSPFMGLQPRPLSGLNPNGYVNRMYPNKYGNYGSTYRSSFPFRSNCYDSRNGQGWLAVDNKYKLRGRSNGGGYGNENVDGLNELNRGPRARSSKYQKGFIPVALAVKGQNIPISVTADDEKDNKTSGILDSKQYNKLDFPETYADAMFYIIKSYSEDDIHKSIKYGVWASTPNGNKKLDAAYQEAQQKSGGCPVFLLFSVNTSGQFVGVAEMVGFVDFHKNFEYWQQDKWNGFFPVKWHIVKDVSNSLLKHITLEYNENKPVTNSRDTQEVKLEQGLQVLKIFKDHSSKTCILDDFPFYEGRQKTIQEKKAKEQKLQKQIWEGKATADEKNKVAGVNGELKTQKSLDPASVNLVKEIIAIPANADATKVTENGSVTKIADAPKGSLRSTAVLGAKVVANGAVVANGC